MARKTPRPGRTLLVFFGVLAIAFGLVALADNWTPKLGLDLKGGTRITLVAKGDVTEGNLAEAAKVIDRRVNGSGVTEAEVTTQGSNVIVVEIPGDSRADLVETVKRQAQLRFRVVACSDFDGRCGAAAATQQPGQSEVPGAGVTVPPEGDGGNNRAPVSYEDKKDKNKGTKDKADQQQPSESPSDSESPAPAELPDGGDLADPLVWMDNPDRRSIKAFQEFQCPAPGEPVIVDDNANKPLVTCDEQGVKYLLSVSMIEGTDLKSASAGIPQQSVAWAVDLSFNGEGTTKFTEISQTLYNTEKQFAIVLDGQIISAPTMNGIITNGEAQITGDFTETEANSLATSLKFGALPITFDDESTQVDVVGPSLAGNQLSAGLTAGGVGLLLVMLYCLLYYRGLGLVVIASLVVAAVATYSMVLLLGEAAGFTLSLPGVAGLIVAVGITADSFVVYFERIRDEMRDGKSMRVAVESGWARARNTCLAADTVSLLAAVVLYIFAAGVVKGFAFGLGLATLIDLVVFFWFTHPMVSLLGRYTFFNKGHKLSGLNAESLGVDQIPVGGKA